MHSSPALHHTLHSSRTGPWCPPRATSCHLRVCTSLGNAFLFNLITAPHPPPLFQALINEADSVTNIAGGYLFMKYQHRAILKASKVLISE